MKIQLLFHQHPYSKTIYSFHFIFYSTLPYTCLRQTFAFVFPSKWNETKTIVYTSCGDCLQSIVDHTQVLITKLRSANTVETRQYRKASKALLVLIPLLGITYLVVLAGPDEGVGSYIFIVARAFLLSTQVMAKNWIIFC